MLLYLQTGKMIDVVYEEEMAMEKYGDRFDVSDGGEMDDNAIIHGFQPECSIFQNVPPMF